MEYYSAIRRNEIGSFVEIWMDLETVTQSEVVRAERRGQACRSLLFVSSWFISFKERESEKEV